MDDIIFHFTKNKINVEDINKICVYALWHEYEIVYIGKTNNINRRLSQHQKDKRFDSYSFINMDNDFIAELIESKLILELKPFYNKTKEKEFITLNYLRNKIKRISKEHKYSEKYYIKNIKEKVDELGLETIKINNVTHIEITEVLKMKDYILGL